MQKIDNQYIFSATDLANYINCKHIATLNKMVADGLIQKPIQQSRTVELLQQRGQEFEDSYLQQLEAEGKSIVRIPFRSETAFQETIAAMQNGADIIYQARLEHNNWKGWADFLIKVDQPSSLGNWSYEVCDTKLASKTKAATILQLSLYASIVEEIQGLKPEFIHVRTPENSESYRVDDFAAYFRLIKNKFETAIAMQSATYPDPVSHCDVCVWWQHCNAVRRSDDHLQFVAGLSNLHLRELRSRNIVTLSALAATNIPLRFQPNRGSAITYEKLIKQARLQLQSKIENRPVWELLELEEGFGLYLLPEPDNHDIFLDFEGDPMIHPSGREYLFGWYYQGQYCHIWAEDAAAEKQAFEQLVDTIMQAWENSPGMHVYHFGAYETTAIKRLMCQYATKMEAVDTLLRGQKFVDLHRIVKQSLQAGVEKYSLKDLEKYHNYLREADLRTVGPVKAEYEFLLQTDRQETVTVEMRDVIRIYNMDDCISTQYLFNWLTAIRNELRNAGNDIPAPDLLPGTASERITKHQERVQPIYEALMQDVPLFDRNDTQQIQYLVANMLDWYGREDKKLYWDKFRIEESTVSELIDEAAALVGLSFTGNSWQDPSSSAYIDEYAFWQQESDLKKGDQVNFIAMKGSAVVHAINKVEGLIELKKSGKNRLLHPLGIYRFNSFNKDSKVERIVELGSSLIGFGTDLADLKCAIDLLNKDVPDSDAEQRYDTQTFEGWLAWISGMNNSVLAIQGPPGTGKSYNAAKLILALVLQGKRIGITALSHRVITGLVETVYNNAQQAQFNIRIIQKGEVNSTNENCQWDLSQDVPGIAKKVNQYDVIAGTSSFWAHKDMTKKVDYLFVDEAGQLSLVDTLVCTFATNNFVLMGDPQQLKQPQQGVHPDGVDISALEHLLNGKPTITPEQGIFLPVTRRMHPDICAFDSQMFYENKLNALPGLELQTVLGNTLFTGSGLVYCPVAHTGNTNESVEEVNAIEQMVLDLVKGDVFWQNQNGVQTTIIANDIKIIAPYNLQVAELKQRLPQVEIGTVDKFQGQEAPIVIYSMATSTPEDAPKGMDFLYSPNRFNVAVSRARGSFILVGSPALFEPNCNSPYQMKLANPLCRFIEMARVVDGGYL